MSCGWKGDNRPRRGSVLDDVIILTAGSQIPADATVVEGSIQANEALITGRIG